MRGEGKEKEGAGRMDKLGKLLALALMRSHAGGDSYHWNHVCSYRGAEGQNGLEVLSYGRLEGRHGQARHGTLHGRVV